MARLRRLALVSTLVLAGCATRPQQQQPTPVLPPSVQTPEIRSDLLGLTAREMVQRLGNPALQVREGNSLKLQFRGRFCVLDAYLYPSGGGVQRVSHIDTRAHSGIDTDQAACIASLE